MHYFEPRAPLGVGDIQRVDLQPKSLVLRVVQTLESATVHKHRDAPYECQLCGSFVNNSVLVYRNATFPASVLHDVVWHGAWPDAMDRFVDEVVLQGDSMVSPQGPSSVSSSHEDASQGPSQEPFDPWDLVLDSRHEGLPAPEDDESSESPEVIEDSHVVETPSEEDSAGSVVQAEESDAFDPWSTVASSMSLHASSPRRRPGAPSRRTRPVASVQASPDLRRAPPSRSHGQAALVPSSASSRPSLTPSAGDVRPVEAQICQAYPAVSPSLARAIVATARQVGSDPRDLANIIAFESNLTFSPQVRNPRTGAVGLIQFDPVQTPIDLGISVEELLAMDPVTQMDWVGLKLDRSRAGVPLRRPYQVGMAVFFPPAIGYPDSVPFPPEVVHHNAGILSPRDYMARVGRVAKLEGSEPFPSPDAPSTLPASSSAPSEEGLLGSVAGWFQSLLGGGPPSSAGPSSSGPSGSPLARVVVEPGIELRFMDEAGKPWSEGQLPSGLYTLLAWSDQRWVPMGRTVFGPGEVYRAVRSKDDGRLHILSGT